MWRLFWTLFAIAACTQVSAQRKNNTTAEPDNTKPAAVIPFRLVNNHIVFPVTVSGSTDTLQFIFDSGAEITVMNIRTAEKMKLNSGRQAFMSGVNNGMIQVPVVTINALYIKELRMPFVTAYLEDLRDMGNETTTVDGVIGVALMKAYIVKIDYRNKQLTLYPNGKTKVNTAGQLLHFTLNFTTPVIDAVIRLPNGATLMGKYHVTSGGDYGVLFNWPYVEKYKLNTLLPTINTDKVQDMVKVLYYINSTVSELQMAGKKLNNVPVSYSKDVDDVGAFVEIAGAIGYSVWKQFTLTINYNKKELFIE
ncbi:aspartyl protease family protein [Chitinophaga sp. sic0106]|uniref:aspartyl protease family protein n=1 Tax=Chitinophaga sp. sic0106 TaxID=2854785 RepID=UPI001C44E2ED|nr:aspartyl protease family protein [Chitinophaga sp. sic0106]MBV7528658.1 aspartyl protease family protein [Chitinophaga sp. sic0106]